MADQPDTLAGMRRARAVGDALTFADRVDAGRRLAEVVRQYSLPPPSPPVVLGLPRGGVVVAAEVARALDAPLDVVVVRKLGVPHQPELAMGAVALVEDGRLVEVLDEHVVRMAGVTASQLAAIRATEEAEARRRALDLRGHRRPVALQGRTVIVVDDGIATGSTARAACRVVRAAGARHVVLAVPVAPARIGRGEDCIEEADALLSVARPSAFGAIGAFYRDFTQVPTRTVGALLEEAAR